MSATFKAMRIAADGTISIETIPQDDRLTHMQRHVGGWIERIGTDQEATYDAYCDEEGKVKGLRRNPVAQALIERTAGVLGDDFYVGPVLFVGLEDDDTELTGDCPADLIVQARALATTK